MLTQLPPSQPPSGSMTGGVKGKGATTSTSSSAVCAGLPTAAFTTWHMARGAPCPDVNPRFRHAFGNYDGPFVVKPVSGRASLHVQLVEHRADLPEAIARIYEITSDAVLIEKYLPGREFCIAAAGPVTARDGTLVRGDGPFTFAALERVLSPDEKIFTSIGCPADHWRALPRHRSREGSRSTRQPAQACSRRLSRVQPRFGDPA